MTREPPPLLHRWFSLQSERFSDRVALLDGDGAVTFRELSARVDELAVRWAEEGIGAGSMVGLHLERSIEWVTGALALLKTGAAVVPLPPSHPTARLREILSFADLTTVVDSTDWPLHGSLKARRLTFPGSLSTPGPGMEAPRLDPGAPAFVLCSSGSTGKPKMIVRSHRSFFHRLRWTWSRHPFEPGERCFQKSHMTTTHALYELLEPLLQGVSVTLVPDHEVRDLERFWERVRHEEISRLLLVPSQLQASLGMPGFEVPQHLRVLVLMGEYVSPSLVERTLDSFPTSTALYSIYGSTEASSALVADLRTLHRPGAELPLGEPIQPSITARVLNEDGTPVTPGEIGRLHIGGPALFSGYFRDPELTHSVLLHRENGQPPLYDTRDAVRLTRHGEMEYIGRVDQTLKIRGFRVEPREVEEALLALGGAAPGDGASDSEAVPSRGVREAAVVDVPAPEGGASLWAFVVPASVNGPQLQRALRDRLPEFMVPSRIIGLETLPRTASGKVDRHRLREDPALHAFAASAGDDTRPLTAMEAAVAQVWEKVLEREDLPPDLSFFEVGGSSLSAFTLVHRLRERFGLDPEVLDVETVYRTPTIGELARRIRDIRESDGPLAPEAPEALITLREGGNRDLKPICFVAPAGGTLGSYRKLVQALDTPRELVGLRDPFTWGDRNPQTGFDAWIHRYVDELQTYQPSGPYHLVAYSSAAPLAWEMARRLRSRGKRVALLALIDPLGLDRGGRSRYGAWVMQGAMSGPIYRSLVRLMGRGRIRPLSQLPWLWNLLGRGAAPELDGSDATERMEAALRNRFHILSLSALLELNTGLPYALEAADLDGVSAEEYVSVLRQRVHSLSPEVDFDAIRQVLRQYPLQVQVQENYRLQPYDGDVLLVEARAPYTGLVRAQIRPYVKRLHHEVVDLGPPSERVRELSLRWGPTALHFRSIRDDRFVAGTARVLADHLR